MERKAIQKSMPQTGEKISLEGAFSGKYRGFAVFLVCCALLIAAFAFSSIWLNRDGENWFLGEKGTEADELPKEKVTSEQSNVGNGDTNAELPQVIPDNAVPIISMDLSYLSLGTSYLHNETVYTPNVSQLLSTPLSVPSSTDKPTVLILHTHTSEGYLPSETEYLTAPLGDVSYTRDAEQNVLAVGETLCLVLNEKGITAIHCTVIHDDPTLSGSYARSAQTVKKYLETYPSIEYVIDLHRDSVITSSGEIVRSVTDTELGATAQVMAVVGSDGNGTEFAHWEENLALALQLRQCLNKNGAAVCRPVSLRNASFYQELAKHSLLLEIGTAANSVEEAKRAAVLVGEALAELIYSLEE